MLFFQRKSEPIVCYMLLEKNVCRVLRMKQNKTKKPKDYMKVSQRGCVMYLHIQGHQLLEFIQPTAEFPSSSP